MVKHSFTRLRATTTAGVLAALVLLEACGAGLGTGSPRLRVRNVGSEPIVRLVVLFPDEQVSFGDLAPGATSGYLEVAGGVYSYAAYRLEVEGVLVTQPVIDWVGEEPMEGEAFTYALEVDTRRPQYDIVRLVSVTRDN